MRPPKICPKCGAALDACERCDCQDQEERDREDRGATPETGGKKAS